MSWTNFPLFASLTAVLWSIGVILMFVSWNAKKLEWPSMIIILLGNFVMLYFIIVLWINLHRPPMRTLGETRLLYSTFSGFLGVFAFMRWRYKIMTILSTFMLSFATMYLFINYIHPETYEKTLMPALQSPWFVPHVVVYIFSYVVLFFSSLIAAYGLFLLYFKKFDKLILKLADNFAYIGFAFLTFGLLFGALWAKEAWGHYWTWDPKETWAFLTWLSYLIYLHFRIYQPGKVKAPLWALSVAFIVLMICWFGINYLPSAQNSVHVYAR